MYFCLEWCERNTFAVYTYEAVFLVFGNDAVAKDLAVPDSRVVKQLVGLESKHHLHGFEPANVAVDADEIHVAIVRKSWREEIGVRGHVSHLKMSTWLKESGIKSYISTIKIPKIVIRDQFPTFR